MPLILISLFGMLSTGMTALFGYKGDQAKTVQSALDVLKSVNDVDGQAITASAQAISAILTNGSFLERTWRPVLMVLLILIIGCWFFGFVPPHFNDSVSPMMREVLDLLKVGVIGYVPCRTLEKIMTQINIGSVLKQLIAKRLI
jgi:hypothetical protein